MAAPLITWTDAEAAAAGRTLYGATGYLIAITTAEENDFVANFVNARNVWIGASDQETEGIWKWVTGPEAGTTFWVGDSTGSTLPPLDYAGWAPGEPNNFSGAEHFAVTNWGGSLGQWNDLADSSRNIAGYIVEFTAPIGGFTGIFRSRTFLDVV